MVTLMQFLLLVSYHPERYGFPEELPINVSFVQLVPLVKR
jgi:hypothetical protein